MAFGDEPRTNHGYFVLKTLQQGVIDAAEAERRLLLIYPEFARTEDDTPERD